MIDGCTACVPGGRCPCNDMANETARRCTIQHRVSQLADERLYAVDPSLRPATDSGWLVVLGAYLRVLDRYVRCKADPRAALLTLAAETQLWLEAIERERAR